MENIKTILADLLNAIYWKQFTSNQQKAIQVILNDEEPNKETTICDYLHIERRGNRTEIRKVLDKHSINT